MVNFNTNRLLVLKLLWRQKLPHFTGITQYTVIIIIVGGEILRLIFIVI